MVVPALVAGAVVVVTAQDAETTGAAGPVPAGLLRVAERAPDMSPLRTIPPETAQLQTAGGDEAGAGVPITGGGPRPAAPVRISIPDAEVDAPVEPVVTTPEGLSVPASSEAGWHEDGPRPGERGRSVIIGHRDSLWGPAVFAWVPRLEPGAEIEIADAAGAVHPYRVVSRAQVRKSRFPAEAVFGPTDEAELVLVTCSGPFERGRGYRDNVLVFARAA